MLARAHSLSVTVWGTSGCGCVSPSRLRAEPGATGELLQHLSGALVRQHLPLHALQGVVDRLRVAAELGRHLLVRRALEVQLQRVRLELGQPGAERKDEALQL